MSLSSYEGLGQLLKGIDKVSIVYSVDPESIVASAAIASLASAKEIDFELAPFYEAPKPANSTLLILVGVRQQRVVGGIKIKLLWDVLNAKKLLALKTIKELKELWIVSPEQVALAIAATLASFKGSNYDERVLESVRNELSDFIASGVVSIVERTLRLFRYPNARIMECLFRTIEPFIPATSLRMDGSRSLIEQLGLPDKQGPLDEEEKKALLKALSDKVARSLGKHPQLEGSKVVVRCEDPVDVYELSYALLSCIDVSKHELAISAFFNSKYFKALLASLEKFYDRIASFLEDVLLANLRPGRTYIRGVRVDQFEASAKDPLNTFSKLVYAHGIASGVTVFRVEDGYCLPMYEASPAWPSEALSELSIVNGCFCSSSMDKLIKVIA